LYLANEQTGRRLFGKRQFMVTVGSLAVATMSDKLGVFKIFLTKLTDSDILNRQHNQIRQADSLLNWTPIATRTE
jgi:hypothetical protein